MIRIDRTRTPADLVPKIDRLFTLSAGKIRSIEQTARPGDGAPVFTVEGRYTARGWTEWTEGFQFGSSLLQFDATGERRIPRARPRAHADADGAAPHPRRRPRSRLQQRQHLRRAVAPGARGTHRRQRVGAALLRARAQGQRRRAGAPLDDAARRRLHLLVQRRALAVRRHHPIAARARALAPARPPPGGGAGRAGQPPRAARAARAGDREVQRVLRAQPRAPTTCADAWRTRASSTSPTAPIAARARSRATRPSAPGRAASRGPCWALPSSSSFSRRSPPTRPRRREPQARRRALIDAARATCDFYIDTAACADGIPYWDTGAPGLSALGDWGSRAADPFNDREPVDSSAAAIGAQGLLRFGRLLAARGARTAARYTQAGLRVLDTLFDEAGPYLSQDADASGAAAALGVSLAQRLGPRPGRRPRPARRVEPVGRLPRARGRVVREAARGGRGVSGVLWTGGRL